MRTYLNFEGRQYRTDSIEPATHVVMLALNREPWSPVEPTKDELAALAEDKAEEAMSLFKANRAKFAHEEVHGRFALKPAVWVDGKESAEKKAEAFRAETVSEGVLKYSEVVVLPVSGANPNG